MGARPSPESVAREIRSTRPRESQDLRRARMAVRRGGCSPHGCVVACRWQVGSDQRRLKPAGVVRWRWCGGGGVGGVGVGRGFQSRRCYHRGEVIDGGAVPVQAGMVSTVAMVTSSVVEVVSWASAQVTVLTGRTETTIPTDLTVPWASSLRRRSTRGAPPGPARGSRSA